MLTPNLSAMPPRVSFRWTVYKTGVGVGGSVSVGAGVSLGAKVEVGRGNNVAVSLATGNGEFVAPSVAVTTRTIGEGQSHWILGSGVSVGVEVIVAVMDAVGVMLGV
jgi:hypothetical protein